MGTVDAFLLQMCIVYTIIVTVYDAPMQYNIYRLRVNLFFLFKVFYIFVNYSFLYTTCSQPNQSWPGGRILVIE